MAKKKKAVKKVMPKKASPKAKKADPKKGQAEMKQGKQAGY